MQVAGEFDGLTALTQGESEQLLFTIQSSLTIRRRYQFYIWAQSRLNAMVPHDLLVCAHQEPLRRGLNFDCFPMFPVPREAMDHLYEPAAGLMTRVIDCWNNAERTPCTGEAHGGRPRDAALDAALQQAGMSDFVAHGMPSPHDLLGIETFFCFVQAGAQLVPAHIKRDDKPLTVRHSFIVELLLPYLHATYQRILAAERTREAPRPESRPAEAIITHREIEILGWVREGKSNQAIGNELGISPLTVKNHVQKILRKLGASNRAQAVSIAISAGLLANSSAGA